MKLNQAIGVERDAKSKAHNVKSEAYKTLQKPVLFAGFERRYARLNEDGETFSDESSPIQASVDSLVDDVRTYVTEHMDAAARKESANCEARADVVVGGQTVLAQCPATVLLFLQKQLDDLITFFAAVPTLDAGVRWSDGKNADGHWQAAPVTTTKTKKVPKVIVKYEATEHHPAQTELVHLDEVVGSWTTSHVSAAMPRARRDKIVANAEKLRRAVGVALEEANLTPAPAVKIGEQVFDYLLST